MPNDTTRPFRVLAPIPSRAENLFLRRQLNIALRRAPPRLRLHGSDRALLVWMTKLWPCVYRIFDSAWKQRTDEVSSRPDEGSVQADSRRTAFALQVESKVGSRNPDSTATDQPASPAGTETTAFSTIPIVFCLFGFITGSRVY